MKKSFMRFPMCQDITLMTRDTSRRYAEDVRNSKYGRMMVVNSSAVIRTLAVMCMLGGLFRILMAPFSLVWGTNSPQELVVGVLGTMFMGIGFIGVYFFLAQRLGKLGFIGFILHSIASFLLMGTVFTTLVFSTDAPDLLAMEAAPLPIAIAGPVMFISLIVSMLLIGIALLKAKAISRIPAIILVVSPLLNFVPSIVPDFDLSVITWGLSFMWMGFEVLRDAGETKYSLTNLEVPAK
jgi:hypothetical protein